MMKIALVLAACALTLMACAKKAEVSQTTPPAAGTAAAPAGPTVAATSAAPTVAAGAPAVASYIFPGAKLDAGLSSKATAAARGKGHVDVYTAASFDDVVAFSKGKGKEDKSAEPPSQVKGARMAVFILDGAASVSESKHYLTIGENGTSTLIYDTKVLK